MSNSRLDSVRETLEHEQDLAIAEVNRLKAEFVAAEEEHKAISDALKALGGKKPKKAGKPAPKKEQVLSMIAGLLDCNGPLSKGELEGLVKSKLTEHGTSHNGFGLRFAEALKDGRLEVSLDGLINLAHLQRTSIATAK